MQQMRVVLAVAEQGSLTAAARQLDCSLPTVVRVLADAERRLGARLFERTTRRLRITQEGTLYTEACRRVLAEIAEVEAALRDRHGQLRGVLSLTAPVLFGQLHVTPILTRFLQQHPEVTARLMLLDRVVDLVDEGVDIAVRIGAIADAGLVASPVGQVQRWICAAPVLADTLPALDAPQALADVAFIQHVGLMPSAQLAQPAGRGRAARPIALRNVRLVTNSGASAIAACLAGLGAGVFLSYQVQAHLRTGTLVRLLPEVAFGTVPVSLVYPPSQRRSARTQAFVRWARQALADRL